MQNGHGRKIHVQTVPNVAQRRAKEPPTENLHARVKTHSEHGDQHVGQRERYDVIVRDDAQFPVTHDGHYDEQITEDRGDDDAAHDG